MAEPVAICVEYPPCPALRLFVHSYWSVTFGEAERNRPANLREVDGVCESRLSLSDPLLSRFLPDGRVVIVFHLGGPWSYARLSGNLPDPGRGQVIGAITEPILVGYGRPVESFGATFHPGQAPLFLNTPASELTDRITSLDCFWGPEAHRLETQLGELPSAAGRIRALEQELLKRLDGSRLSDARVHRIADLIWQRRGAVTVESMSHASGVSRQHLARQFRQYVGFGPKLYCRVARFHALLGEAVVRRQVQWADAATDLGYYDQAHLIADFKEFTGLTPSAFFPPR